MRGPSWLSGMLLRDLHHSLMSVAAQLPAAKVAIYSRGYRGLWKRLFADLTYVKTIFFAGLRSAKTTKCEWMFLSIHRRRKITYIPSDRRWLCGLRTHLLPSLCSARNRTRLGPQSLTFDPWCIIYYSNSSSTILKHVLGENVIETVIPRPI